MGAWVSPRLLVQLCAVPSTLLPGVPEGISRAYRDGQQMLLARMDSACSLHPPEQMIRTWEGGKETWERMRFPASADTPCTVSRSRKGRAWLSDPVVCKYMQF